MGKRARRLAAKKTIREKRQICEITDAVFSSAAGGLGFAVPCDPEVRRKYPSDIFIPPGFTMDAMDGDHVSLCLLDEREKRGNRKGPVAKVISILKHGRTKIIAELTSNSTASPMNRHLPQEVRVSRVCGNAQPGDWVQLRLLDTKGKKTQMVKTEFVSALGESGILQNDLAAIVAEYDLKAPYTPEQNEMAEKLEPADIPRTGFLRPFTITIDPADARDFDDAISLGPGKNKEEYILGVHIADVAAYVPRNSTFDKLAAERAFSAYLPGMFLPMLPAALTRKISLREGCASPAHSILFTVNKNTGKILSFKRLHTLAKIKKRLDYATVQAFLNDPHDAPADWTVTLKRNLKHLTELVREMRQNRMEQEMFLDIPLPEIRAVCNEDASEVTAIQRKMPCEADGIVEECMLAANTAVARELIEKNIPGLFRIHPDPDPDKIDQFSMNCLDLFHISTGDILSSRTACRHFLENLPDDHRRPIILSLFLHSLPRASYEAEPGLHYGLGKIEYSHFTSPIRRYADLCIHQQLWAYDTNSNLRSKKKMSAIALDCSVKEENNDNAYFDANDRMKLHYLRQHGALENGTIYEAVISRITATGLLCSIDELGLYGFIPREKLRGGEFRKQPSGRQRMRTDRVHQQYKTGDFIYVLLDSLDLLHGSAVFRPAL